MTTKYGTQFFVSRRAAIKYYKTQEVDVADVDRRLREGEITIGMPPNVPGEVIELNREEGRYFIHDDPSKRHVVSLQFRDSRYDYRTEVNGTRKEICKYFQQPLSMSAQSPSDGDGETILLQPIRISFIGELASVFNLGRSQ